jgi:hypothetical protein
MQVCKIYAVLRDYSAVQLRCRIKNDKITFNPTHAARLE